LRYEILLRKTLEGERLDYLVRKWTLHWIHVNNIFAILFGLILSDWMKGGLAFNNNSYTFLLYIIGIYVIGALWQLLTLRDEIIKMEHYILSNELLIKPIDK
jgi:undecaprenyl pyrophosphate phosphatase UppP